MNCSLKKDLLSWGPDGPAPFFAPVDTAGRWTVCVCEWEVRLYSFDSPFVYVAITSRLLSMGLYVAYVCWQNNATFHNHNRTVSHSRFAFCLFAITKTYVFFFLHASVCFYFFSWMKNPTDSSTFYKQSKLKQSNRRGKKQTNGNNKTANDEKQESWSKKKTVNFIHKIIVVVNLW